MIKTYKLSLEANKTKLQKIKEIAKEYKKIAKRVLNIQLSLLFKESKFNKNHKLPQIETKLSARYLQTLQYQIVICQHFLGHILNIKFFIYKM